MTQDNSSGDITGLLIAWSEGDEAARDELMRRVYRELYNIAQKYLRHERRDHTLGTRGLVNEAYLRLIEQQRTDWRNRAHFYALASKLMRRILVDHARKHSTSKRGGQAEKIRLEACDPVPAQRDQDLVALDEALDRLAALNPAMAQLVELRFFGGCKKAEIAEVLGVSVPTISRRWELARAWLHSFLVDGECHDI